MGVEFNIGGISYQADSWEAAFDLLENDVLSRTPADPKALETYFHDIKRATNSIADGMVADDAMLPDRADALFERLSNYDDTLAVSEARILSGQVQELGLDQQRALGTGPETPDAPHFTVAHGNHRTATTLVMYHRGELPAESVVGQVQLSDGTIKPLLVSDVVDMYESGNLHTSNLNSRGEAWVDFSRVRTYTDNFDIEKFFDAEASNAQGIIISQVPEDTSLARYAAATDPKNPGNTFSNFLYQQVDPNTLGLRQAAEAGSELLQVSSSAKAARVFGNTPVLGAASAVVAMGLTSTAQAGQREYAQQLFDENKIDAAALDAYVELNRATEALLYGDAALSTADPTGFSIFATIGAEMKAQQMFQDWVDAHAPNLPAHDIETLSVSLFGVESAQHEMFMTAAGKIPHSPEGQDQVFHDLIEARNAYFITRSEEMNERGRLGGQLLTRDEEAYLEELTDNHEAARNNLIAEMNGFFESAENATLLLSILPEEDRLEFARRLAASDPDQEILAAEAPELAAYVAAYEDANIFQTGVFGFEEQRDIAANMEMVDAYILRRSGLNDPVSEDPEPLREMLLAANEEGMGTAPPELQALYELREHSELFSDLYQEMHESGTLAVAAAHIEHHSGADTAPELVTEADSPNIDRQSNQTLTLG